MRQIPENTNLIANQSIALRLLQEGVRLRAEGSKVSLKNALPKFEQALSFYRGLGDRSGETTALVNIGFVYKFLGEMETAIDYYNQALSVARANADPTSEAVILHNLGATYSDLGNRSKALDLFNQALPLRRAVNDRNGEAYTMSCIGTLYRDLGDKDSALKCLMDALTLARTVRDHLIEGATLDKLGNTYSELGQTREAVKYHKEALSLFQRIGDRRGEGYSLTNLGRACDFLGEREKALEYYRAALALRRETGDRIGEANTLSLIGHNYAASGDRQKAFDHWQRALALGRSVKSPEGEAAVLNGIGSSFSQLGEWQGALDNLTRALSLYRHIGDRKGEAQAQVNLGGTYRALGELQKAANCFSGALNTFRVLRDLKGEAAALALIAFIYHSQNEEQKALGHLTEALRLSRRIEDRTLEANLLNSLGMVHEYLGDQPKALDCLSESLSLNRKMGSASGEAASLNNIAFVHARTGDGQMALDNFQKALSIVRKYQDLEHEATILSNIASFEEGRGNLLKALDSLEKAIGISESLRSKVISKALRASYLATKHHRYDLCCDLFMRLHLQFPGAGYDIKALQIHERGRARSLAELLTEHPSEIREVAEPALIQRELALKQQLNAKARQQMMLSWGSHTREESDLILIQIQELVTELQQVEAEIRKTNPKYLSLTQPRPLSVREIQTQVIDANSLMLIYSLGARRSYVWAITKIAVKSHELLARDEIESVARELHELLNARNELLPLETPLQRERRLAEADLMLPQTAARLSELILNPIADLLNAKRLLIVSDSALQFIPFAVLPFPKQRVGGEPSLLISKCEIVNVPSPSVLAELRKTKVRYEGKRKNIAVFADPVFDKTDPRLKAKKKQKRAKRNSKKAIDSWRIDLGQTAIDSGVTKNVFLIPRLPGTRYEAEQISAMVPSSECRMTLDFDANREAASDPTLRNYRFVHFATHGFLNTTHPELSGIVLSLYDRQGKAEDGFLRLHDVFNLKLAADLVVLSACQTGLGKDVKGEGIVGLLHGFLYAGARRVMVSLWSVSDAGTSELMIRFYRGLLIHDLRPAEALRRAQLSMLEQPGFQHPYYWAPFILQGEYL